MLSGFRPKMAISGSGTSVPSEEFTRAARISLEIMQLSKFMSRPAKRTELLSDPSGWGPGREAQVSMIAADTKLKRRLGEELFDYFDNRQMAIESVGGINGWLMIGIGC